jgi:hypothetical protein
VPVGYKYLACHPIGRQLLAPALRLEDPSWTEVANGNGTFTAQLAIPRNPLAREQIRAAVTPGSSAIYVQSDNDNFPFAGPITQVDRAGSLLKITAVCWRSWLYGVFLGPKTDLTADNLYGWTNQDQLLIARQIVGYAIAAGATDGRPPITIGTEVSGKLRDLNVKGLEFKFAGELLDTLSRRSGGFEWDLRAFTDGADGLPRVRLVLASPEISVYQTGLLLRRTSNQGNIRIDGDISRSVTERRTRVWTTGASETLPFAQDSDAALATGGLLLSEKVTSYSTVTDRTTLSSHARAERQFLSPDLNILPVEIPDGAIDPDDYLVGDRIRLVYQDDWETLDLDAVRIIERTVSPGAGAGSVKAKLDLTDYTLPEVDSGVTTA